MDTKEKRIERRIERMDTKEKKGEMRGDEQR
jgi:hypothetical protein